MKLNKKETFYLNIINNIKENEPETIKHNNKTYCTFKYIIYKCRMVNGNYPQRMPVMELLDFLELNKLIEKINIPGQGRKVFYCVIK